MGREVDRTSVGTLGLVSGLLAGSVSAVSSLAAFWPAFQLGYLHACAFACELACLRLLEPAYSACQDDERFSEPPLASRVAR